MKQNEMLAMILAGGRGSRLKDLTNKVAKPAVSFGGKYRIIDFPLSNCSNSGIDVIGVLTQYESVLLNSYVAAGRRWGLDSKDSGVFVLPPREKADANLDVYRGTADAISQNIDFIDKYDPEYLLVLSGDHIYKMNYDKMLDFHKENNADATIAVFGVPMKEASRFGIMNTDETGRIVEFEEKPEKPKSNLASMGIYIFNWKQLRKMLISDMKNEESHHDFGKDIIPTMLGDGCALYSYEFKGYWKDVGTIDSLWEANMDLLDRKNQLNLGDAGWLIYSENQNALPQYIGPDAKIDVAYITQGSDVEGTVKRSVLFTGTEIAKNAVVSDTVLMPNAKVGEGAKVTRALVADGVSIGAGAKVGSANSESILLVAHDVKDGEVMTSYTENGKGTNKMSENAYGIVTSSGSRFRVEGLQDHRPIGAFSFLGRYRVIDFPVSNLSNSGVDHIQVYVSQNPRSLAEHLAGGQHYNINTKRGKLQLLFNQDSPLNDVYNTDISAYAGNLDIIERMHEEYVILTPGYMVFTENFSDLIEQHIESGANISLLYHRVNNAKEGYSNCQIIEFDRQKKLKSILPNLGTANDRNIFMDTYVMKNDLFLKLIRGAQKASSIYTLADVMNAGKDQLDIRGIQHKGYFAAICDFMSYFDANMDLLNIDTAKSLFQPDWTIYTQTTDSCPTKYVDGASVRNSMIANGCVIEGTVENSVIGRGVTIKKGAVVKNCLILGHTEIDKNVHLEYQVVDKWAKIVHLKEIIATPDKPGYIKRDDVI